jgi:hypothetical protein
MLRSWWARWARQRPRPASRRAARPSPLLELEALESRCLLSATPGLAAQPLIAAVANQPFSGLVASFTPPTTLSVLSAELSPVINWGDGHTSPGTISPHGGSFDISGGNTYASTGSFSIVISLSESDGSTLTATTTAIVFASGTIVTFASNGAVDSTNIVLTAAAGGTGWVAIIVSPTIGPGPNQTPPGPVPPPSMAPSNSSSLTVLTSASERLPWASQREQLPAASISVTFTLTVTPGYSAQQTTPTTGATNAPVVYHQPVIVLVPGAAAIDRAGAPIATTSPALKDESGEKDLLAPEALTSGPVTPETPRDDGPAIYHRPLEQVADRAELFTLNTTVPYLLPQQEPVAPATLLRGDPEAAVVAADVPPVPPEPAPSAELLLSRVLRYWLLPATACIVQGLGISPMVQPRQPRLRRVPSAPGQE